MRYPAFICILLSLLPFTGNRLFAQDTDPRDSLNALLETRLSDQQEVDVYNQLAFYNFDVNDSMAMIYAKTAHKLANAARYIKGEKYATTLIGLGLSSAGEHKEAITYFKKSHELTVADSENIASYNLLIWGTLHAETGNYDSALTLYTQARKLAKSPADLQSIYKNMARVYIQVWKNELAIQYLDSASLPTMGDDYMQMEIHGQYGLAYINLLEFEKAKQHFNSLCELANRNSEYYHKIECKLYQARMQLIQGEYNASLVSSLDAIELSNEYNLYQYVEVLIQTGEAYLELSQLAMAAKYFYQALKISEERNFKHKTAIVYNNLAWLTKIERDYSQAIENTIKAETLFKKIGDQAGLSEAYNVRGLTYVLMPDEKKAEIEFTKAIEIRRNINNQRGIAASVYNLADLYLEQDKNEKAVALLYEVAEIEKKIGNKPNLSMTYGLIGRQLIRDKKYNEAFQFLKKAETEGKEEQSLYIQREVARSFVSYYKALEDYKNVYHYQREYEYLTDDIHAQERSDKLAEYEALFKTQKREQEIELLNEKQRSQKDEIELQQLQLVQKNTLIIFTVSIIVLLGLIGWRGYRYNKKLVLLNKEITQQKEEAEKANTAKSEFLANVSHELRTPLNGVIGFSDLLIKTQLNQSQQKYIGIVNQSANTLLELIDNILDFSKLDANKLQLRESPLDVRTLACQVADMVRFHAESKGLKLEVILSEEVPHSLQADEIRLKQVLANLVSNAVKFTTHGKIELRVQVIEKISDHFTNLRFSVSDTGKGINPENQKKIFDAFFQEDISTTKKFGGTGLGLTISNKLLTLMNSELKLSSEPGKGSTFYFDVQLKSIN